MSEKTKRPPTLLVVFGISGDLSRRYLLPSLLAVLKAGQLPSKFKILGISRRDISALEILGQECQDLAPLVEVFKMDMAQNAGYQNLKNKLETIKGEFGARVQVIFDFAVPPAAVLSITRYLGEAGLNSPEAKLMLEKPFGTDLESARELIDETSKFFKEDQIYRIDHYLAKEMAQNIAVFLNSNALFRDVWNARFVEKIEVIAVEEIGIEGRPAFYEQTGALRDVVQSHLMQLAALVLMEPCSEIFAFTELPERRLAAMRSLQLPPADQFTAGVIRAQYYGYRQEVGNPDTTTETFVALTLNSNDPRWKATPIHLIAGKNLNQKTTEIRIHFKKDHASEANLLTLYIQPQEGIELELWVKEPGFEHKLQKRNLSFSYDKHFGRLPGAYEQVLVDAMRGNRSLFASSEEVLASWAVFQPVLQRWSMHSTDLKFYKPGSTIEEVLSSSQTLAQ